jgi:hypothetical protein
MGNPLLLLFVFLIPAFATSPEKRPVVYVPVSQPEHVHNLISECPGIEVTGKEEKAEFFVAWEESRDSHQHWVIYRVDGTVVSSGETMRISATARDICKAILK